MKLVRMQKVRDGRYLKNYNLTYLNKTGAEKEYEIVSRRELEGPNDLGSKSSGVSIVIIKDDKLLMLKEFRMGVNQVIFNLVAGMLEDGETIEECIIREVYEETGLHVKKIKDILPPAFAAVAISDMVTNLVFVEAEGELADHSSDNEQIEADFYDREEIKQLLNTEKFSSRCQMIAYFFMKSIL